MPKRCIVRMHRLDSRERVPACSSPQDLAQNACLSIANFAGPSRACPGTRYSARIGGPLRVFFSAVYALSVPRTCTFRRPVKLAFSLCATCGSTSERLVKPPVARSTRSTASSPLDPPIDDVLISCVERAQDGWDAQYLTDQLQVARLTSSEVQAFQPAEWRHDAKFGKGVEWGSMRTSATATNSSTSCASRTCSASAFNGVRVAEKKGAPVAITVHSLVSPYRCLPTFCALSTSHSTLFLPPSSLISAVIITRKALSDANDVQLQQYALGTRFPTETSKPAHALVLT